MKEIELCHGRLKDRVSEEGELSGLSRIQLERILVLMALKSSEKHATLLPLLSGRGKPKNNEHQILRSTN